MPTCRYHNAGTYICEAQATHRLSFDTISGKPLGAIVGAETAKAEGWLPEAVFCQAHAGDVSQAMQQRWEGAQGAKQGTVGKGKQKAAKEIQA